jgi:2-dehydropantoate 2-reductase
MKNPRIAIVSAGAVGGYVGAHLARAGHEPILIDGWPAHVEHMRQHGISITGTTPAEAFTVPVRALHVCDVPQVAREAPFDIALICPKSYDTEWAAMLIRPYLAADGCAVSVQNCMNDERLAGVLGWSRTLGCIASKIMVDLMQPGHVHRGVAKGGKDYTVFRVGETHGRITERAQQVAHLMETADSARVTSNLWGERWSKLVANCMENGMSAATGMSGNQVMRSQAHRRLLIRLAGEAVRIGQAAGYALEPVVGLDPEKFAQAGEGDAQALAVLEDTLLAQSKKRSDTQVASMGQDMRKGRRTEIEFMNGHVVSTARSIGRDAPLNRALTDLVLRVERGELKADPGHIAALAP